MPYEPPTLQDRPDPSHPADLLAAEALPAVADDESADDMLGESPPEHGWLGKGFVWTLYTLASLQFGFALYVLVGGPYRGVFRASEIAGMLPMLLFFPLLYVWVAHSVQTFKLQGLGVAMLMLLFAAFSTLRLLLGDPDGIQILAAFAMGALEIGWIRYFWNRRPDFT